MLTENGHDTPLGIHPVDWTGALQKDLSQGRFVSTPPSNSLGGHYTSAVKACNKLKDIELILGIKQSSPARRRLNLKVKEGGEDDDFAPYPPHLLAISDMIEAGRRCA